METSANVTPASAAVAAPAPVATTAAPSLPPPQVQEQKQAPQAAAVEEGVIVAQNEAPAPPVQETDTQNSANRVLPQTGGYSGLELMIGLAMLGGGIATVFASCRKSLA